MEEIDDDIFGDFMDHVDDFLDVPDEDIVEDRGMMDNRWLSSTFDGGPIYSNSVLPFPEIQNKEDSLSTYLSLPGDDLDHLEWLSNFVEESSLSTAPMMVGEKLLATTAPTDTINPTVISTEAAKITISSQGEISSGSNGTSCAGLTLFSTECIIPERAGCKRSLPTSSSSSSSSENVSSFIVGFGSFAESNTLTAVVNNVRRKRTTMKKKKKKFQLSLCQLEPKKMKTVRKCLHCETEKTPQWRAGPLGPKTLCNACGVRFNSGRLFPEYRPVASPTFVPSLHSNSHKKVVEMRMTNPQNRFLSL